MRERSNGCVFGDLKCDSKGEGSGVSVCRLACKIRGVAGLIVLCHPVILIASPFCIYATGSSKRNWVDMTYYVC